MKKILVIYAPQGGYTENIATQISKKIPNALCTLVPGNEVTENLINEFSIIIIGVATLGNDTWNSGIQDPDSANLHKIICNCDFSGKKIALFGLGNAIMYPSHFIDDVGIFAEYLEQNKAIIVGYTSTEEFTFKDSKALRGDKFCGLAIDFDNEPEKTTPKIETWISQLRKEFEI